MFGKEKFGMLIRITIVFSLLFAAVVFSVSTPYIVKFGEIGISTNFNSTEVKFIEDYFKYYDYKEEGIICKDGTNPIFKVETHPNLFCNWYEVKQSREGFTIQICKDAQLVKEALDSLMKSFLSFPGKYSVDKCNNFSQKWCEAKDKNFKGYKFTPLILLFNHGSAKPEYDAVIKEEPKVEKPKREAPKTPPATTPTEYIPQNDFLVDGELSYADQNLCDKFLTKNREVITDLANGSRDALLKDLETLDASFREYENSVPIDNQAPLENGNSANRQPSEYEQVRADYLQKAEILQAQVNSMNDFINSYSSGISRTMCSRSIHKEGKLSIHFEDSGGNQIRLFNPDRNVWSGVFNLEVNKGGQ